VRVLALLAALLVPTRTAADLFAGWWQLMCGQAAWRIRGQEHATRHDVATADMIRQLPSGFALVIRGGCAPVIARLPRAWHNPAYKTARRRGQATAILAPAPAAAAISVPPEAAIPDYVPDDLEPGDGTSFPWS
jgi:hypothetical protein